jgi:hypothetical protein
MFLEAVLYQLAQRDVLDVHGRKARGDSTFKPRQINNYYWLNRRSRR